MMSRWTVPLTVNAEGHCPSSSSFFLRELPHPYRKVLKMSEVPVRFTDCCTNVKLDSFVHHLLVARARGNDQVPVNCPYTQFVKSYYTLLRVLERYPPKCNKVKTPP